MEYMKHTTDFRIEEKTVVSLGKFDGIHRGHGYLLEYLEEKKKSGLKTVIFTFDIPPKRRILNRREEKVLTTNEEKAQIFEQYGIDYLIECPFTEEFMHMEPEDFIDLIVKRLNIKSLVVGKDFHFGKNRRGDYRMLERFADVFGYEVDAVDKIQEKGREISSTFIREEISAGRIEHANELLGYPYFVQGNVVHGNEIGRTLNVPTANLIPAEDKLLPPFGVYVTETTVSGRNGQVYGGITNVGCKPTVSGINPVGVETHLFQFEDQIYGDRIKVEFLAMVRPEQKFQSLEKLKEQMHKDIQYGKRYYANITKITKIC